MIYHFEQYNFHEIFQKDGFPKIHHISFMELRKDQSYQAMHSHKGRVEILYILSGEGNHMIGKHQYQTEAGDLMVINEGVLHEEKVRGEKPLRFCCCAVTNLWIRGLKKNQLVSENQKPLFHINSKDSSIKSIFSAMRKESIKKSPFCNYICTLLSCILCLKIMELKKESPEEFSEKQKENEIVIAVKEYIDQNFQKKISLQDAAQSVWVSPWYLDRLFKKYTGESFTQYVIGRKLGYAQNLLRETEESIHSIAEKAGYDTPGYFHQLFKKKFGMTPGNYRKLIRKTGKEKQKEQENNI